MTTSPYEAEPLVARLDAFTRTAMLVLPRDTREAAAASATSSASDCCGEPAKRVPFVMAPVAAATACAAADKLKAAAVTRGPLEAADTAAKTEPVLSAAYAGSETIVVEFTTAKRVEYTRTITFIERPEADNLKEDTVVTLDGMNPDADEIAALANIATFSWTAAMTAGSIAFKGSSNENNCMMGHVTVSVKDIVTLPPATAEVVLLEMPEG